MSLSVRLFINGPDGLLPFKPEHAGLPLPWGLDAEGPVLTYGTYFNALANFLGQHDYQPLLMALRGHLERHVSWSEIQNLEIISQKHGTFYHVAQVWAKVSGKCYSFAINSAVRWEQQIFLESEFALLQDLNKRYPLGFIPRVYALGVTPSAAKDGPRPILKSFITEWFEGYHEFHLSEQENGNTPLIRLWDACSEKPFLDAEEIESLYRQAASILTTYFDPESFSQIYPWHHAAGDFVLKRQKHGVELRLITVRGYLPLVAVGSDPSEKWIPIVHFFLNLSLRMRLDRLDGTGDLAWALPDCLRGVVSGFLETWGKKSAKDPALPTASQVLKVLQSFAPDEWLSLADLVLTDGLVEAGELEFIKPRLGAHVTSLCSMLCHEEV